MLGHLYVKFEWNSIETEHPQDFCNWFSLTAAIPARLDHQKSAKDHSQTNFENDFLTQFTRVDLNDKNLTLKRFSSSFRIL